MAEIQIVIDGIAGADGTYILNPEEAFTNRELHRIKLMSGVRMGEIDDALGAGDNDLLVAFTAIALTRSGKTVPDDALWDAPPGAVRFVVPKVEADARPPALTPIASPANESERQPISGDDSSSTGDSPVSALRATGTQG